MTKFTDLDLNSKVLKAVAEVGYETPTPIQAAAIPLALTGRDVLGIAQTGTGKTASFTLPMITKLARGRARARMPRSLVLAPTRELATQVAENFKQYAKYVKLDMALLIGGVSFKEQDKLIDRGVDVLIATPGRLLDHFERGKLLLTGIEIMVVDEADRMLDMGFIPDIERIFKMTPFTRQTLFFSATMAPEITRITQEFLQNPERVEVARQATTSENITQKVCVFQSSGRKNEGKEKRTVLRSIIASQKETLKNGIIFCNRKVDVDIVAKSLRKHGYDTAPIHGDLDQSVRTNTLDKFRNGELDLLVASDVAARGLDVPDVSHVFNFDVPIHAEDYVHRIGRTGRAGRQGAAFMLCLKHEEKYLAAIEDLVKQPIPRLDAPDMGENKPRRERTRKPKSEKPAPTQQATDAPKPQEAPIAKAEQPAVTEKPAEPPAQASSPAPQKVDVNNRNRGGRNSNNNNKQRNASNKVVGLGEHMPAFMLNEWRVTKDEISEDVTSTEEAAVVVDAEAVTSDESVVQTGVSENTGTNKVQETATDDTTSTTD
jgi:ATP-dependent RNA helicase RhlE